MYRSQGSIVFGAIFLVAMIAGQSFAQSQTTVDTAVTEIEDQVQQGDSAANSADRLADYKAALDKIAYLEIAQTGTGADAAAAALAKLADAGVTADVLRTAVMSATIDLLRAGVSDFETETAYWVQIQSLLSEVDSAPLQISTLVDLASLKSEDDPNAALGYLQQGIQTAAGIADEFEKNSALNAIAVAADQISTNDAAQVVNMAIEGMWPARARGFARYVLASSGLADSEFAEAETDDLAAASQQALEAGNVTEALNLALAIDIEADGVRTGALNAVLNAVVQTDDVSLFPVLATAYADNSDQEDAIAALIDSRIAMDRLFDAQQLADNLPAGPVKARFEFVLATALAASGFDTMAAESFDRGVAVVDSLAGPARDLALAEAIAGAVELDQYDVALSMMEQVSDLSVASSAMRLLGKSLADAGRIEDARLVLADVTDLDDREYLLSGIATAQVKAGDVEAGVTALGDMADAENHGRLAAEIVRTYARDQKYDAANELASSIQSPEYAVSAYIRLADIALDNGDIDVTSQANASALSIAKGQRPGDDRDESLTNVAESLAKSGDFNGASAVAELIEDVDQQRRALSLIAKSSAQNGSVSDALGILADLPDYPTRDEDAASVLVQASKYADYLAPVMARVQKIEDPFLRTLTFRQIATVQLARLDVEQMGLGSGTSFDYKAKGAPVLTPAVQSTTVQTPTFAVGDQLLYQLARPEQSVAEYGYPSLEVGVADLRQQLPSIKSGQVAVTLAHLSPYNDKFFEDLAGGQTGLDYAGRAQGLLYPRVIVVQSGVYTLGMLVDQLTNTGNYDLLRRDGDVITLRAPLLVGAGATLILSGQEAATYRMSVEGGAFISVAGDLYVLDTTVSSWQEALGQARTSNKESRHEFRPFIIGWSGSHMYVGGSVLDSLGYAAPKSFGLSFSAGPKGLLENSSPLPAPGGIVVDNLFHNFEYGFYSYEAEDVLLVGNEYRDNVVYGIDPHDRSHRLVIALNTAYNTEYKHGIIISREVDDSWIVGNVSFDNVGSGFMLDRDSTDTLVYGNVAFGNQQDGLTLFESSCNIAMGNHFFDNGRSGIKIRNSWDVGVLSNIITGNGDAAIDGYTSRIEETSGGRDFVLDPYVALTTFLAADNLISDNKSGIKVDGVASVSLFNQSFHNQSGPLLGGEGRPFEGQMLRFTSADSGVTVVNNACAVPQPSYYCGFRQKGILGVDGQTLAYSTADQSLCHAAKANAEPTSSSDTGQS